MNSTAFSPRPALPTPPRSLSTRFPALARLATAWLLLMAACAPVHALAAPPFPGGGFGDSRLAGFSFSDTNWLTTAGASPLAWTNAGCVSGGNGNALRLDSEPGAPSYLSYPLVNPDNSTNLQLDTGSVAFWYRPHQWAGTNAGGNGPGELSRLLEIGSVTGSNGWWSVFTDPGGGNLYFAAQAGGGGGTNDCVLSAPATLASNVWHFVVLTYGTNQTALYLDGNLLTNAPGLTSLPDPAATTNGFFVGSASDGSATMHGDLDELATYNYELSPTFISETYGVYGLPIYGVEPIVEEPSGAAGAPPFSPDGVTFSLFSGPGIVVDVGPAFGCTSTGRPAFSALSAQLSPTAGWTFNFTVTGGTNGVPNDLFATARLAGDTLTNSTWVWLGQVYACRKYQVTQQPTNHCAYVLGGPKDSDGDGLTDVFEELVTKTLPNNANSAGGGIPDLWLALNRLPGPTADLFGADPDGDGLTNQAEYLWGSTPTVSEGFAYRVATANNFTGLP